MEPTHQSSFGPCQGEAMAGLEQIRQIRQGLEAVLGVEMGQLQRIVLLGDVHGLEGWLGKSVVDTFNLLGLGCREGRYQHE